MTTRAERMEVLRGMMFELRHTCTPRVPEPEYKLRTHVVDPDRLMEFIEASHDVEAAVAAKGRCGCEFHAKALWKAEARWKALAGGGTDE